MPTVTLFSENYSFYPFRVSLQEGEGAAALYNALEEQKVPIERAQLKRNHARPYDFSEIQEGEVITVSITREWNARLDEFEPVQEGGILMDLCDYDFPKVVGYKFYFSVIIEERKRYLMVYYYRKSKKFHVEKRDGTALLFHKDTRRPHRGLDYKPLVYDTLREALLDQAELTHNQISDMMELASSYPPFV